jgi:predicted enzyme related to lactoylglutathione lyase
MPATLGAVGIGVSDMAKSVSFYERILGYKPTQTFDVEQFTETVMAFPHGKGGSQIILMQYKNRSEGVQNPPGKLVWYVEDVKEVIDKCKAEGLQITLDLGQGEGWVGKIAIALGLDGEVLEFMPLSLLKGSGTLGNKI